MLLLSPSARREVTGGELVGKLTVDTDRIERMFRFLGVSCTLPVEVRQFPQIYGGPVVQTRQDG